MDQHGVLFPGKRLGFALAVLLSFLTGEPTNAIAQTKTASAVTFDVLRFSVSGATLLDTVDIDDVLMPFVGPERRIDDIHRAIQALTLRYRERGFSAVHVALPEQESRNGVIELRVTEGRISSISIAGNDAWFSDENILASLPVLKKGASPRAQDLDAAIRLANESNAKQISINLLPGVVPGSLSAKVDVAEEAPGKYFVTLDSTGTSQTGNTRVGVGYSNANLFDQDHAFALQYTTSAEHPQAVSSFSGSYHLPFYAQGLSADLIAAQSDMNAGTTQTTAGALTFAGKGLLLMARLNQRLGSLSGFDYKLVYGVDWRSYDNTCSLGAFGAAGCGTASADITLHPVSLTWAVSKQTPAWQWSGELGVLRNISGGSRGEAADFSAARAEGNPNYMVLKYGTSLNLELPAAWRLRTAVSGQWTRDALVSPEMFGIGGYASVRGWAERVVSSDTGHQFTTELTTPDFAKHLMSLDQASLRAVFFVDTGRIQRNKAQPGESTGAGLASLGFGFRFVVGKNLNLRADMAQAQRTTEGRTDGQWRGHLGLAYTY